MDRRRGLLGDVDALDPSVAMLSTPLFHVAAISRPADHDAAGWLSGRALAAGQAC